MYIRMRNEYASVRTHCREPISRTWLTLSEVATSRQIVLPTQKTLYLGVISMSIDLFPTHRSAEFFGDIDKYPQMSSTKNISICR